MLEPSPMCGRGSATSHARGRVDYHGDVACGHPPSPASPASGAAPASPGAPASPVLPASPASPAPPASAGGAPPVPPPSAGAAPPVPPASAGGAPPVPALVGPASQLTSTGHEGSTSMVTLAEYSPVGGGDPTPESVAAAASGLKPASKVSDPPPSLRSTTSWTVSVC